MSSHPTERWRGVVAALLNDDLRTVLAEIAPAAPLTPARRERAIDRLILAGVLRRDRADVAIDTAALRALLAAPVRPTGPERFLDADGRIDRYPAGAGDRRTLLEWIAERAFPIDETLSEGQVNERLAPFAPGGDVAVLRRYLVDHELLERTPSGSEYAPVAKP